MEKNKLSPNNCEACHADTQYGKIVLWQIGFDDLRLRKKFKSYGE